MANYTLGIVSHVDRQEQTAALSAAVHADRVLVDDGSVGVTQNHLAVLIALVQSAQRTGCEWIVVLEDDAQPVTGFHQQLSAALDVAPSRIVSLYNGTGHPANRQAAFAQAAAREDVYWILHKRLRHAVGYAVHTSVMALGLHRHIAAFARQPHPWPPDDAITDFARRNAILVSYTNPSLVDHEDGISMIKTRNSRGMPMLARRQPRKAHWVGTRMSWRGQPLIPIGLDKA